MNKWLALVDVIFWIKSVTFEIRISTDNSCVVLDSFPSGFKRMRGSRFFRFNTSWVMRVKKSQSSPPPSLTKFSDLLYTKSPQVLFSQAIWQLDLIVEQSVYFKLRILNSLSPPWEKVYVNCFRDFEIIWIPNFTVASLILKKYFESEYRKSIFQNINLPNLIPLNFFA